MKRRFPAMEELELTRLHDDLTSSPPYTVLEANSSNIAPSLASLDPDSVPDPVAVDVCKRSLGLKRTWSDSKSRSCFSSQRSPGTPSEKVSALLAKVTRPCSSAASVPIPKDGNKLEDGRKSLSRPSNIPAFSEIEQENLSTLDTSLRIESSVSRLSNCSRFKPSNYKPPGLATNSASGIPKPLSIPRIPFLDNKNLGNEQKLATPSIQMHESTTCQAPKISRLADCFYSVMYCMKKKNTKHKGPWFDGILIAHGSKCTLQDTEGRIICKAICYGSKDLAVDATIEISKYEVEIMRVASAEEYASGTLFTGCFQISSKGLQENANEECSKRKKFSSHSSSKYKDCKVESPHFKSHIRSKSPGSYVLQHQMVSKDALVLNANHLTVDSVPIVVDPYLVTKLRPHQREGVKFMYECVMGLKSPRFTGCLLADEMGLGKTVQVIALIWTLIQQASAQGNKSQSSFKHIVVVCPSSLVQNWGNEVRKWLGIERLKVLVVHACLSKEVEQKILDFKHGRTHPLLITSYELLRKHQDLLASTKPGLLVCDEAHRLKNSAGNKTISALLALNCPRRVLLTGTPVQNDLNEFYAMVDFANPNLLGPISAFKRLYTEPIELSKHRDASDEVRQVGQARMLELQERTKFCILRRTAAVNKSYLPVKTEYFVFCQLQPLQVSLYDSFLRSQFVKELFLAETSAATVLTAIGMLRKLCNHPRLVLEDISKRALEISLPNYCATKELKQVLGNVNSADEEMASTQYVKGLSGKLDCVDALLSASFGPALKDSSDKVVVVSNFTQTLNLVQALCASKGWKWLRLDGATVVADRQLLVDRFNLGFGGERVFLLSSKAGGMGLNLIGANRLILFDPDWNPATDAQAMARIWREGQKKPVTIYRLLATGSIEEKIYQRQMVKGEIAATVEDHMESSKKSNSCRYFSRDELRDLFSLNTNTRCDTFDLLSRRELPAEEQWIDCAQDLEDPPLQEAINRGVISFVQRKMQAFQSLFEASA